MPVFKPPAASQVDDTNRSQSFRQPLIGLLFWGSILLAAGIAMARSESAFVAVFIFRYLRLAVAVFSYIYLYKHVIPLPDPPYDYRHVAVIVPTVDPGRNKELASCLRSILRQGPRNLIISIGGPTGEDPNMMVKDLQKRFRYTEITIVSAMECNKRAQVAVAARHIRDEINQGGNGPVEIVVLADDHVFWPSPYLMDYLLAPFEDQSVALVGTNKRVRRQDPGKWSLASIVNLLGCLYLERHNFEIRASNAIPFDNGVFVISGRTQAHRARWLCDEKILQGFTFEMLPFGLGPLKPDDDNFFCREYLQRGLKLAIQHHPDAVVETTLGKLPNFKGQLLRWARTTFRSNTRLLLRNTRRYSPWRDQIWSVYSVYIAGMINFALLWDPLLIYTFLHSPYWETNGWCNLVYLILWMLCTKMVKPLPHYIRNSRDIRLLPVATWVFAYVHSLIKLWALLTVFNISWSGRNLASQETRLQQLEDMRAKIAEQKSALNKDPEGYLGQFSQQEPGHIFAQRFDRDQHNR